MKRALAGLIVSMSAVALAGPVLVMHGTEVIDRGPLPPSIRDQVEGATSSGVTVGYCFNHFSLFSLDLWSWDGRACVHDDHRVWELNAHAREALEHVEPEVLSAPLQYRFPPGLLLLIVGSGALFTVGRFIRSADHRQAERLLKSDGRYRDALEALRLEPDGADATQLLVSRGIPADSAKETIALFQNVYFDGGPDDGEEPPAAS